MAEDKGRFMSSFAPAVGEELVVGGRANFAGHGPLFVKLANAVHFVNISGLCLFQMGALNASYLADFMQTVVGWDYSLNEALDAGERAAQLRHAFNLREGINVLKLPVHPRIIGDPAPAVGPNAGFTVPIETLSQDFAAAMSWNPDTAVPSAARMAALGLSQVTAVLGS